MNHADKIKNRIDFKALTATLAVQSKSRNDAAMLSFIRERLSHIDATVQEDGYGNLYVTKGEAKTYPCVVAHTDTVHEVLSDVNIFRTGDTLFAFDPVKRTQCGIGGDDKVGVYITLQLLEDFSILKAVFFRDEEIGCRGSSYSITHHKDWYKDCGFVLMADRRGNNDLITVSGGIIITSKEFLQTCEPIISRYGYKETVGIFTDVDTLTAGGIGVSTVNLSCGYFEPHYKGEFVSLNDINTCYNMMYDILTEHSDKVFEYKAEIPSYKSTYKKYGKTYNDTLMSDVIKNGVATPVYPRQTNLFPPYVFGKQVGKYDLFAETDVIKDNYKVYMYKGDKALVLTGGSKCSKCHTIVADNVYFLPYEGRMMCTNCADYVNDAHTPALLHDLEVDDNGTAFVYSLYSAGWLPKSEAKWDIKIMSWVSTQLPF